MTGGTLVGTRASVRIGATLCGVVGLIDAAVVSVLAATVITRSTMSSLALATNLTLFGVLATGALWTIWIATGLLRRAESLPMLDRPGAGTARLWGLHADDADELASLMHDAAAAPPGARSVRLRHLDEASGPLLWAVALARAWTRPLATALRRALG